ncbi:MAG TPA: radical SAM protein [Candidatus Dormibacteraeota bacterium]|nr:radical SAM protein [Candidatus Dormibacteraeota bacterium]
MPKLSVRRTARHWSRTYREARMVALALKSPNHPILAHVVVTRRCNLACTYCNEFDNFSNPVPTAELLRRIDLLAALGTTVITLTGGEPLLHPDLEQVIGRIRQRGIVAVLVTNGYLLTIERIERLNRAGLDRMQISVDNVNPDDASKKSLKVLDKKLQWLAQFADFPTSIHSVVGAHIDHPEDALTVARRATELGLISTVGVVHDDAGRLEPLNEKQQRVVEDIEGLSKSRFSFARHNPWRANLVRGLPNEWHCTAGGRHLYICEDGLVHLCLAQRGYPGTPLSQYTREDVIRESKTVKPCAPYCTIFCVQRVASLDKLRTDPKQALVQLFPARGGQGQPAALPAPIRVLKALFLPAREASAARFFRKAALRFLKVD